MVVYFLIKGLRFVGSLYLIGCLSVLLHELAHLLAALVMGMKIRKVFFGSETILGFWIGIVYISPLFLPAYVDAEANKETFSSQKMACFVFSGPFVSLSMALLFFLLHNSLGGYINLFLFLSSLLPFPRGKTDMGSFLAFLQNNQ